MMLNGVNVGSGHISGKVEVYNMDNSRDTGLRPSRHTAMMMFDGHICCCRDWWFLQTQDITQLLHIHA